MSQTDAATIQLPLRYGLNPHQVPALVRMREGKPLPLRVLNGAPGYINLLDALNSWQLVRELKAATNLPAAASFKHVSPAGAAVGIPLSSELRASYLVRDLGLSPLAAAYARARGADRVSSFGDWAALSDVVDESTSALLVREVSDGVIAPGFEPAALAELKKKQGGRYVVLEIDPAYEPEVVEQRDVFGITFQQRRNDAAINGEMLANVVTPRTTIPESAQRDLLVALVTLKYTQSNSMGYALDGQMIGIGAGQQSRIHCTRLAGDKADLWYLRQHPSAQHLPFRSGVSRTERNNAIDAYLRTDLTPAEETEWLRTFESPPVRLTLEQRVEWLARLDGVSLASDAFIPFRDNIDRAARSGVRYVAQPGGSNRDADVIAACEAYGIAMTFTGLRLFHH